MLQSPRARAPALAPEPLAPEQLDGGPALDGGPRSLPAETPEALPDGLSRHSEQACGLGWANLRHERQKGVQEALTSAHDGLRLGLFGATHSC